MDEQVSIHGSRILAERMGECVVRLQQVLDQEQRALLQFAFTDLEERTFWNYTPLSRQGLALHRLDRAQQQKVTQLLHVALSTVGYNTVALIMALETILDGQENFTRSLPGRDPLNYYLSVFGEPHAQQPWSWRFEGHHISLHFTISQGLVVSPFPLFFGSNPAESELAGSLPLRPLQDLEDPAWELLHTLDEEQLPNALLTPHAPRDMLLGSMSHVVYDHTPSFPVEPWMQETGATPDDVERLIVRARPAGIGAHRLSTTQQALLCALVRQYLVRLPDELAQAEEARMGDLAHQPLHFAWAGQVHRGGAHYYRIQSPRLLIEYDNYQNDANHIHAVWRDPQNDFGADMLRHHYARHH